MRWFRRDKTIKHKGKYAVFVPAKGEEGKKINALSINPRALRVNLNARKVDGKRSVHIPFTFIILPRFAVNVNKSSGVYIV